MSARGRPDPYLFPPQLVDCVLELEREIEMRARVYPRWITAGKLTANAAAWQMACLRLARDKLREIYS